MTQTVLITGSNSGFGLLIANTLLAAGYQVIASMRDPQGRNASIANDLKGKGAFIVDIDVTNDDSVSACIANALEQAGSIDVLINNAGVGTLGWQDSYNIDDFKAVFDINVFGVQRMIRAVLPHMKARGNGTIIQISSLLGKFVLPYFGAYNATKHAVEALSENYRIELSQFGIQSLVVQPGGFGTDFGSSLIKASDSEVAASYGEHADAPAQMLAGFEQNYDSEEAPDPQMVADAVLKLLQTAPAERPFRTTVDGLGMDGAIQGINTATENAMQGIYSAFGMDGLFELKQDESNQAA